jgi:hypothetical protein
MARAVRCGHVVGNRQCPPTRPRLGRVLDVLLSQLLHLDIAEFGQGRGQVHPVSVQRRGFEAVFGGQPVLTCFGERDAIWS